MAPCGGLQQIFENPPPENPSLLESLSSWKPIRRLKSIDQSYTELFGELHFRENTETSLPSALVSEAAASWLQGSASSSDQNLESKPSSSCYSTKSSDNYLLNPESLQLCTEGLGFESLDSVEDMKSESGNDGIAATEKEFVRGNSTSYMGSDQYKIAKSCGSSCPPPISCIERTGKTQVSFKSRRQDGRFVLEEVRIPTQEYLFASREGGRLRLCLVQPDDGDDFLGQGGEEIGEENGGDEDDHHNHD